MTQIIFRSATKLTKQIRDKDISCELVVKQFLEQIKKHDKMLNN